MPARRFADSRCVDGLRWGLNVGLLGLLLAGCQSVPLRSSADRPTPTRLASGITASLGQQPELRQLPKTQRELAIKSALAESKAERSFNRASFRLVNWQCEELPPVVGCAPSSISEDSLSEAPPEEDCERLSVGRDFRNALPTLWCDTQELVNWNNALILTAAGGLAIGIRESDLDQRVRDHVAEHPQRWGDGTQFLGKFGEVKYQAPVMLGVYGYSIWTQNEELHGMMGSMINASVITGVSTSVLKLITNTDRPSDKYNNGQYGFPSYHTASTFAIAAVLDDYYGCQVGLPAYVLAAAVGFSRIDDQDHDLSDVVFGSALGFVIGKTVAGRHLCGDSNMTITPYIHPTDGTPGVAWETKF
ncbi:MAG: phosphatase PAP2 family protein [Planctomycetaceae bacterium]|nr:phosphatase PAP2 family protein [Planctomycetaceae bacterium]